MKLVVFGLVVSSSWGNGHATLWRGLIASLARRGWTVVFFEKNAPWYRDSRDVHDIPGGELVFYETFEEALPIARRHLADADVAMVTSYCPDGIAATVLHHQAGGSGNGPRPRHLLWRGAGAQGRDHRRRKPGGRGPLHDQGPTETIMTASTAASTRRGTILVVDDEPDILTAIVDLFEDDYEVLTARSAADGLDLLARRPEVAAIVSDQRMPEMTGDRFIAAARDLSDAGAILLTGYADLSAVVDAVNKGGIVGYVPKPWDPASLRSMVEATAQRCLLARDLDVERTLLQGLLESSRDAVSFKDREGRFVRLNSIKAADLGCDVDACVGRRETELAGGREARELLDREVVAEGRHDEVTEETTGAEGQSRWICTRRTPIRGRDGLVAYLMTVERDVTEDRFIELRLRQSEKMQALGTLAGGIAHDFNNLLTAIIGGLDLAERRLPEDPKLRRFVTGAREAAERGAILTKRLLGFSRQTERKPAPTPVDDAVRRMRDLLDHSLGGTVRVAYDLEAGPALVEVDPDQLELAVLNLCVNARDAMPDGGIVRISTRTEPAQDPGGGPGQVVVAVTDTGTGMPPELVSRVFEPFFTTKDVGKGTGLGLSMVYTFATGSGGTIAIDSAVGKGTTVEIRLPLHDGIADAAAPAAATPRKAAEPVRVMVVDDDPAVRAVTAGYIAAMGHRLVEAESGEAALRLIDQGVTVDVMVVDYAMPGMTGVELAGHLRDRRRRTPILFVTGHAEADAVATMERYLTKPFRQDELQVAITDLVGSEPG